MAGKHPVAWDELRWNGPLRNNRWDPQPGSLTARSTACVSDAVPDYSTDFAEFFQGDHAITLTSGRALSGWRPVRPVKLLNLTGWEGSGN
ncbi:hypothetical protein [uncultured Brachybacterium sp.]|uniref:hypothetical protein n=1 Tax=uncultured Brachybacterium sp. TaxID=189680 RepID=UPI00262655E4|nr:hypothetical protein [uncultured Brachybacterium sp.]